jgi:hypothetical protein
MPTELETRTDSNDYNANTLGRQIIHEEYNSAYNHHILIEAFNEGRAKDISEGEKSNGEPCFILGSGASLDRILPYLKDWKGGIICTTSHALSLIYHGIEPTHILALDPFNCWHEINGIDWSKTRTKLITTPGVWPTLIEKWPNEILLYIQNLGNRETYYSQGQKRMYTVRRPKNEEDIGNPDGICRDAIFDYIIRTEITQFACSPPCQMFAAQILGYGRIFLAGCDFGIIDDKDRFTNYIVEKPEQLIKAGNSPDIIVPAKWKAEVHPFDPNAVDEMPDGTKKSIWIDSANGLKTNTIMLFYKKNLITAWRLSLQDVYSCDKGIMTEIPYADIEKVIKTQGKGFKRTAHDFIIRESENYLAKVGAFVVNVGKAYSFVEAIRPLRDWIGKDGVRREGELISFMKAIYRKWECQTEGCGGVGQAEDDRDHSENECPRCHKKSLKRAPIDMEANIKKFRKLLNIYGPLNEIDTQSVPTPELPNGKVEPLPGTRKTNADKV